LIGAVEGPRFRQLHLTIRVVSLAALFALLLIGAIAAAQKPQPPSRLGFPPASSDLALRQDALEAAKQSADPGAITAASRKLIALSLRQLAARKLTGSPPQSLELCRRAIDFDDTPDAHLDLAAAYLLANQADQALSETNNVIYGDSQNARAWHIQGRVWLLKQKYPEAIKALTRATDSTPNSVISRLSLQAKRADRVKPTGNPFPKIPPQEFFTTPPANEVSLRKILASALNDLGTSEARQQRFDLALAHFHEAERWDPQTPGLMRNIGLSAARVSDYKEAARALRPVLASNPQDQVARTLLGTALFSTGNFTEAAQVFSPLGDSVVDNFEVAYTWASALVKINKYPEGSALLDKLEQRQLSSDNLMLIAQTWSQMGNYAHTAATCHRALQTDPQLVRAHYMAGMALLREDKPAEAEQEFRGELQLTPDDIDAQYNLAFVLTQQSKSEEALRLLRAVVERRPDHPEANYELGKQLLADSKPADAIPYLEAAARLKPQLEPVHYQLQSAYRAVGRKQDADREARVYREMKIKSRNITLPPPREQKPEASTPR
jgi:tetratricopeptide (TPR) repeat protein